MADAAEPRRVVLTYEDYLSLPNDRYRYEIHDGELIVTSAPGLNHQDVLRNLVFVLLSHIKAQDLGKIYFAPIDVILDDNSIVQPDLVFISKDRYNILTGKGIEGVPDLVVEIISPGTARHDRIAKFQIYSRFGVKWYWMLDPGENTLEEHSLSDGAYSLTARKAHNDTFEPILFPGLRISLSEIW